VGSEGTTGLGASAGTALSGASAARPTDGAPGSSAVTGSAAGLRALGAAVGFGPALGAAAALGAGAALAAAPALGAGADFLTAASPAPADSLANSSRSLRATGASTVEDADFTNSPMSFSLASTVLLSTPSSRASSCTRGLPATSLPVPEIGRFPARPH